MTRTVRLEREGSIAVASQIKRWLFGAPGMGCLGLAVDVILAHDFTIYSMLQPQRIPIVFGPR